MSFGHPLLLLALLVVPLALVALPRSPSGGGCATRCATRTSTCSRRRRRPPVAALRRGRASSSLALAALCVAVARPHVRLDRRRATRRRSSSSSTSPARCRRGREADAPRRRAEGDPHVPRQGAEPRARRARSSSRARRRSRRRRRPTTQLVRAGGRRRRATSAASAAPRSATRSPPRCSSACRSAGVTATGTLAAVRTAAAGSEPRRELARLDPLPLRRPPDARDPPAARRAQRGRRRRASRSTRSRSGRPERRRCADFPGGFGGRRRSASRVGPGGARGLSPDPMTLKAIATATGGAVLPRAARPARSQCRLPEARLEPRAHARTRPR